MFENSSTSTKKTHNNVPNATSQSVPLDEVGHSVIPRRYISEHKIKEIAIEKYKSSGLTIRWMRTSYVSYQTDTIR
jgi:hypothetical protein